MNTYLGPKGYTIPKNELTNQQQVKIRNDLTIKPFVMGSPNNDANTFPAYRESPTRFFIPHYYGVEHFGPPKQYKISEGTDINLTFNGKLRDYQEPVVNKFVNHCLNGNGLINDSINARGNVSVGVGGGLLELYCAWGKTSASLNIITKLKKKTLVIVHKEFLMNQWIERIKQFLPEARVGKIQGPIIDVEDKDIVIGMLQSLISKDYEPTLFEQFGFTIIDEVHHISSQSFSNSLFRIVTKYMLGLSATMDRKDGTTAVFKMFLGDVIFKSEKKNDHPVEVRAITYKVNDDEFNETIMNYKGQVQNSSMISKLCEYNRRTEFIIKTLCDFISVTTVDPEIITHHKQTIDAAVPNCEICNKNNNYLIRNTCCDTVKYCMCCMEQVEEEYGLTKARPKCPNCKKCLKYEQHYIENIYVKPLEQTHTIIMSHNLNILHYIYKKMVCKNLASVGYYVGGMDEISLKKSEKKQIILATYSMAQEGLDIFSLNAEFLISPKTDIVQIVGRILRAKHDYSHPIIYDFVDSHDVFQRQWAKRKSYYKKQNYKIIGINSMDYKPNFLKWKIMNEPKKEFLLCNKAHILSDDDDDDKEPTVNEICLLQIKK
jgi:superfamily II DNA or RNA helicase